MCTANEEKLNDSSATKPKLARHQFLPFSPNLADSSIHATQHGGANLPMQLLYFDSSYQNTKRKAISDWMEELFYRKFSGPLLNFSLTKYQTEDGLLGHPLSKFNYIDSFRVNFL